MTTPFIAEECIAWANRKDLPEVWQKRIKLAWNEPDWRGELLYVWLCWLDENSLLDKQSV